MTLDEERKRHREYMRQYLATHPEQAQKNRDRVKQWVHDNRARHNAKSLKWMKAHPDTALANAQNNYRKTMAERPEVMRARWTVQNALRRSAITKPSCCSSCNRTGRIEAHHHNGYAKEHWLDIVWLCPSCHRKTDYPECCST